jgi:hypothetical protein
LRKNNLKCHSRQTVIRITWLSKYNLGPMLWFCLDVFVDKIGEKNMDLLLKLQPFVHKIIRKLLVKKIAIFLQILGKTPRNIDHNITTWSRFCETISAKMFVQNL